VLEVFQRHEVRVGTANGNGLTSDQVLGELRRDLLSLGFDVEEGKRRSQKILRPVFFGENGIPTVLYEIDGYHPEWQCGLEIEAGRAWMGNAVYRNLITACVMVQVDHLVLAVPNAYRYKTAGRLTISKDYDKTVSLAEALYGHSRLALPYDLVVIGY
jgi:hypothetical protein